MIMFFLFFFFSHSISLSLVQLKSADALLFFSKRLCVMKRRKSIWMIARSIVLPKSTILLFWWLCTTRLKVLTTSSCPSLHHFLFFPLSVIAQFKSMFVSSCIISPVLCRPIRGFFTAPIWIYFSSSLTVFFLVQYKLAEVFRM